MEDPNRAEAERLLGISEKLLQTRDLTGSRDFAILAQETEPLLDGSDQILAVTDVLLAAEKRMNNHHDWYSILQLDRRSDDQELIKKQYRRLALLLHPDKNKFPLADQAFKLVADAWAVLNDTAKKALYDNELTLFSKVDLTSVLQAKLPVRRNMRPSPSTTTGNNNTNSNNNSSSSSKKDQRHGISSSNNNNSSGNFHQEDQRLRMSSFWTMCPYCYNLFEYPRVYEGCCLRCQNCQRAFHAAVIPSLPPVVPGQDAYYCCWGFFPMGFVVGSSDQNNNNNNNNNNTSNSNATKTPPSAAAAAAAPTGGATTYPNWMPQPQESGRNGGTVVAAAAGETRNAVIVNLNGNNNNSNNNNNSGMRLTKKRGRPRKYSVQS